MQLCMLSSSLFISQNICNETIAGFSNVLGPPYNNSRRRRCWHQFLTLQGDCPWSASGRIHCCCGSGRWLIILQHSKNDGKLIATSGTLDYGTENLVDEMFGISLSTPILSL